MGIRLCLLACLLPGLCLAASLDRPGWVLLWNDEFDGTSVDATKWRVEDAGLVKNRELQYYAPEQVSVSGGRLVLRAEHRAAGGREFVSGLVETRGKFAQAFGRFEIRAKMPRSQGLWPAIWLLPDDGSWPPEIDIAEVVGSQPNIVTMSLHSGEWPDLDSQVEDYMGPDFSAGFHEFAIEWEPGELRYYVDDQLRFATKRNVPQIPFFLILNVAVGGEMPGDPDETTAWPQQMEVDSVRVYGQEIPGTCFLTTRAEHGRVSVRPQSSRYKLGSAVALTATPSIGYRFGSWGGSISGDANPLALKLEGDRRVIANFVPMDDPPALLSKGAIATASSLENAEFPAANAVDGDPKTRWSSQFADDQWLLLDLGAERRIEAVKLDWENAYARSYAIDVSSDGRTWRNVHGTYTGRGRTEEIIGIRATARYVRLACRERGTEWGFSLWEFSVYGR